MSEHDRDVDHVTGVETTGHSWDGIKELNNPLPRWWLWIFYATIAWAVVYWILMPAIPGLPGMAGATTGVRGHSDRALLAEDLADLQDGRAPFFDRILAADSLTTVLDNPELRTFAMAAGESAFGDNCATCHGENGAGLKGYPSLQDDDWLWGGTLVDIRHTLEVGIRAGHQDTRLSIMPAYGRDGLLSTAEIADLTEYVLDLAGREADPQAVERARPTFEIQCAACHMESGKGDRTQGAPNLTDAIWLYGDTRADITRTIHRGPYGVMPHWSERLDPATLDALTVYVHTLGGGEPG